MEMQEMEHEPGFSDLVGNELVGQFRLSARIASP